MLLKLTLLLLPFFGQAVRDAGRDPTDPEKQEIGDDGVPSHWLGAFRHQDMTEKVIGEAWGSAKNKLLFVSLACDEPQTPVALKIVPTTSDLRTAGTFSSAARSEATVMQMLEPHPNLIRFFAWSLGDKGDRKAAGRKLEDLEADDDKIVLAMEYGAGGTLSQDSINTLTLPTRLRIFRDIVAGVAAMHGQGIRHGDLKPEQIVLTAENWEDPSCVAKVSDFGSSCLVNEIGQGEDQETQCGSCTPEFQAPETWLYNETTYEPLHPPTLQNDHWSLGAILYEMVMKSALIQAPPYMRWKDFTQESKAASENTLNISKTVAGRIQSELFFHVGMKLMEADVAVGIGKTVGDMVAGLLHKDPASRTELADAQNELAGVLQNLGAPSIKAMAAQVPPCFETCISHEPKCRLFCAFMVPGNKASLACVP